MVTSINAGSIESSISSELRQVLKGLWIFPAVQANAIEEVAGSRIKGDKCYATLTSAQTPQLHNCDDASCPPVGSSSTVGHRTSPKAATEPVRPAADTENADVPPTAPYHPHQIATDATTTLTKELPLSISTLRLRVIISNPLISTNQSHFPLH
jgi:hypothetical protein